MQKRLECLQKAAEIMAGERYGAPEDSFGMIAKLWGTYLGASIEPRDVAVMMILLKAARVSLGVHTPDNYIDMAGYAACAYSMGDMEDDR